VGGHKPHFKFIPIEKGIDRDRFVFQELPELWRDRGRQASDDVALSGARVVDLRRVPAANDTQARAVDD
jgi:hypothetical protein